jgi:hypothetical protein
VTSVRGVGIGAPAVQNDSVIAVAVVVVCATDIGKIKTSHNKNKPDILTIVKVGINMRHRKCRSCK